MEHVVLAQHSILLLRSLLQIKCLRGSAWHPAVLPNVVTMPGTVLPAHHASSYPGNPSPKPANAPSQRMKERKIVGGKKEC